MNSVELAMVTGGKLRLVARKKSAMFSWPVAPACAPMVAPQSAQDPMPVAEHRWAENAREIVTVTRESIPRSTRRQPPPRGTGELHPVRRAEHGGRQRLADGDEDPCPFAVTAEIGLGPTPALITPRS
ncbi:hypothetical protein [Paenirhodobacter sp.]|uniref:hypothetical protein n=1 Tax=Paenirhodobacter sp. TaxID=1965326 RepID=UPI003B3C6CAB